MERETIGEKLKGLRETKGLSQRKLAKLCGLDNEICSYSWVWICHRKTQEVVACW